MFRSLVSAVRIGLAVLAMVAPVAVHAQGQPVQWRYAFDSTGVATATYPGNVVVNGSQTIPSFTTNLLVDSGLAFVGYVNPSNVNSNWVETTRPNSTSIATTSIVSKSGLIGLVTASRSSDNACTGCMGVIGIESIVLNDNTTNVQYAYGGYFEATRKLGAGTTHGIEIDVRNDDTLVPLYPNNMFSPGATPGLWVGSGAEAGSQNNSAAIGIVANGSKWDKGILFDQNGLALRADNKYTAVGLGLQQSLTFYDTTNIIGNIYGFHSAAGNGTVVGMRFDSALGDGQGGVVFENGAGAALFSVGQGGPKLAGYTVATLPNCSSTRPGIMAYVTDATAPTYNGALVGGGAVTVPVFCNGTTWTSH